MKTGDWVFCEFKLQQITEMKEGRVTGVSTGYISMGSYDLRDRIFPMTKRIKVISEEFERSYSKLHDNSGTLNLNFPDFNRWYIEKWVETCKDSENDEYVGKKYDELYKFERTVLDQIKTLQNDLEVEGIPFFRPKIRLAS